MKIKSIKKQMYQGKVHDLTINGNHNYYVSGCLVHNCHESSTKNGKHGDLDVLLETLKDLPAGVELAIGGGNPLDHPDLIPFLQTLKERGIVANITVNQGHLKTFQDMLVYLIKDELVKGVGISITSNNFTYIKPLLEITDNIVYHIIAGVNKVEDMEKLIAFGKCKVLILGYKHFGFGINFHSESVDKEIRRWFIHLPKYLGKCVISFDNLAIEQLDVKRLFTNKGWDKFYMGDDGRFTMYVDGIKQKYAQTSRSHNRIPFSDMSLFEYFTIIK
jgi:hypothetical protein